jgi:hypothetical protein
MTFKTSECKVACKERVLIFSTDAEGYGGAKGEADANRSLSVYVFAASQL